VSLGRSATGWLLSKPQAKGSADEGDLVCHLLPTHRHRVDDGEESIGGDRLLALELHAAVFADQQHRKAFSAERAAERSLGRRVRIADHDHVSFGQVAFGGLQGGALLDIGRLRRRRREQEKQATASAVLVEVDCIVRGLNEHAWASESFDRREGDCCNHEA
jgi:hypothetical protein